MFATIKKKITRWVVLFVIAPLSTEKKRRIERRLRGREEARKLKYADWVLVSWGKSGRTWFRVMISHVYKTMYGLTGHVLVGFDNLHRKDSRIPKVFFTHGNYLQDYTGNTESRCDFYDKKVVMLVRDPRDIAVSQFFQWQNRMKPHKKTLNLYPEDGADISMFDFVMQEHQGMPGIIRFMNRWAADRENLNDFLVIRYEDLRKEPERVMKQVMEFTGADASDEDIKAAVDYAAFENMKKMEEKRVFRLSGGRMVPKDPNNPDSFKVRRAKVGGFRDYFTDEEVAEINKVMARDLDPVYGYVVEESPASTPAAEAGAAS
jgi:hypothetical protein